MLISKGTYNIEMFENSETQTIDVIQTDDHTYFANLYLLNKGMFFDFESYDVRVLVKAPTGNKVIEAFSKVLADSKGILELQIGNEITKYNGKHKAVVEFKNKKDEKTVSYSLPFYIQVHRGAGTNSGQSSSDTVIRLQLEIMQLKSRMDELEKYLKIIYTK